MESQIIIKHPIFLFFKKHFCLKCNQQLKRKMISRIVTMGTMEAQRICGDLHIAPDTYGQLKVIWYEFECANCREVFGVDELYKWRKDRNR